MALDQTPADRDLDSKLNEMCESIIASRAAIEKLLEKKETSPESLNTKDGISLLSWKNYTMLSYLQSLALLTPRRLLGHSLLERSPPSQPFSDPERDQRGSEAGDLVDSLIEGRVVLEKIKVMEDRMRYQIDKLLRLAKEDQDAPVDETLNFKANPGNFASDDEADSSAASSGGGHSEDEQAGDEIYRPPRIAAVPYTESSGREKNKKTRKEAIPQSLAALRYHDAALPHAETTSGLGSMPSLQSKRARELKEMDAYEEENFTRLALGKKEAKRRARDEADVALGGGGEIVGANGRRRRAAGGLEDEFGDVLRGIDRAPKRSAGDGYDELRQRGKRKAVLERSRSMGVPVDAPERPHEGKKRKRSRFEAEQNAVKRKLARSKAPRA